MSGRGHSGQLLTVAELIGRLQAFAPDALVYTEGSEGEAEATGVEAYDGEDDHPDAVLITGTGYHATAWRPRKVT